MHPFHILLALFGLSCLIAFAGLVIWERGNFLRRGKAGAWLRVRLATIPIVLLTAALVVLPARSTSGMEGLAVFYIALLTIAPVFWFAAHWAVGRLGSPPLLFSESAQIAASPLALGWALVAIAHALQPIAWSLLRAIGLGSGGG